jgi:MHS family proline/betaine transporter-like MFS transporter
MKIKSNYILACLIGNTLEWYDFILYGIFSGLIAKIFFPPENPSTALMAALLTLAIGYFTRPLGGIIFGHFGDTFSRRKTLVFSLLFMGITTTLMGLLPSYAHWGILSTILLVALRMLQGLAVGGEFPGTMIFLLENATPKSRAFVSSFAFVGAMAGILVATSVSVFMNYFFSADELSHFAWRIPFLFGAVLALMGIYWRMKLLKEIELPRVVKMPLYVLLHQHIASLLKAFGYLLMPAVFTGMTAVYIVPYFMQYYHFSLSFSVHLELLATILTLISLPIAAYLADRSGQYRLWLLIGLLLMIVLVYPLFVLMQQGVSGCVLGLSLFVILASFTMGPEVVFVASLFKRTERYSGVGLAHGFAFSIVTGTSPLVLNYLAQHFGNTAPSGYIILAAVIAFIAVRFSTHRFSEID